MMTLTQTAILTKRIILFSVLFLVLGIAGFIGYRIWNFYYLASLPPVEEKPDTKFGLLPPLEFPQSSVSTSNFSYSLDTVTGGLPKPGQDEGFEKIIKVYFLTQTFATLLAPEKADALAKKFNIKSSPQILNETRYRYREQDRSLLVDLDTGNFAYTKQATLSGNLIPDDSNKLVEDFKQLLSNLGILKTELQNGRNKITTLKTETGKLVPTSVSSETEAVLISLWPASLDQKPVLTADFNKSLVNATVLGAANLLDNYLSLNFTYYPIDTSIFATYPLKPPELAFDDLKNGKGVIIIEPGKPQISITSVYLGYFLSEKYSPYLQPIYVFEGPGFVAYVAAISEELQSQATEN